MRVFHMMTNHDPITLWLNMITGGGAPSSALTTSTTTTTLALLSLPLKHGAGSR